jgi:hypothetical protein
VREGDANTKQYRQDRHQARAESTFAQSTRIHRLGHDRLISGRCGILLAAQQACGAGAVICGAAELSVSLLTDYPGGVKRIISFRKHGEIDLGLAAMSATMPEFLVFKGDPERKFFLAQGILITAANEITQFPKKPQQAEKGARRARAA